MREMGVGGPSRFYPVAGSGVHLECTERCTGYFPFSFGRGHGCRQAHKKPPAWGQGCLAGWGPGDLLRMNWRGSGYGWKRGGSLEARDVAGVLNTLEGGIIK